MITVGLDMLHKARHEICKQ